VVGRECWYAAYGVLRALFYLRFGLHVEGAVLLILWLVRRSSSRGVILKLYLTNVALRAQALF
jgi:hypothetical protein